MDRVEVSDHCCVVDVLTANLFLSTIKQTNKIAHCELPKIAFW